ncbi:hypothetical protein M3204_22885 [Mesobacillus subterraneus]|uniref:hypothetical protein n=1 Tax=Mesobacillus subterraneus TaxID=285983 RepID=UPI00203E5AD0|nr:hypothetical protein [Mesobacillus subterraneus]MCM3667247.1 hypothetical protein [Mesobacillus subterraneus]MCM3686180.1 hypothetical protein [Mesobacillus subterraneus]
MKQFLLLNFFIALITIFPSETNAIQMPCSMVLAPADKDLKNAMGTALVYKVQLNPPSFARTNVSIIAIHLPEPKTYGNYDSYEGFAFKPNEISWRFQLYPTPEKDSPSWAGRFDLITAAMENVQVQVRLSNSKTEKLGPSVLGSHINYCK